MSPIREASTKQPYVCPYLHTEIPSPRHTVILLSLPLSLEMRIGESSRTRTILGRRCPITCTGCYERPLHSVADSGKFTACQHANTNWKIAVAMVQVARSQLRHRQTRELRLLIQINRASGREKKFQNLFFTHSLTSSSMYVHLYKTEKNYIISYWNYIKTK